MQLTEHQNRAITSPSKNLLVLAGPGSGKTRVLCERIRYLITSGVAPAEIVVLTFTNSAAKVIQGRVGESKLGFIGTLHGFMLRLCTAHASAIGYGGKISVVDADQAEDFLVSVVAKLKLKATKGEIETAIALGPRALCSCTPASLIASDYFRTMRKNGLMDFDMVLHYGLEVAGYTGWMKTEPKHLLCDENQDSALIDNLIYDKLPIENKFFVGDPDQSIYQFRGANVGCILHRSEHEDVEVIRLEGNFRCGSDICAVAQSLIIHNPDRIDKRTVSMTGRTGDVDLWKDIPTPGFEMQTLARDIIEKKAPTAAVLLRSNALAREYAEALKGAGVEVQEKKQTAYPADWRLTRALLAVLSNPSNDALARMYLTVKHGPHEADVAARQAAKAMHTINAECLHFQPLADPVDWNYVTTQLAQAGCTPQSLELVTVAVGDLPADAGMADLLFAFASEQNTQEEAGTGTVVTTYHAAKGRQWHTVYLPAFEQAVIPGARKYPTEEAKAAALEEERRLAYVGMTRALGRLVISYCQQRKTTWGFKPEPASPSQFLAEAGLL